MLHNLNLVAETLTTTELPAEASAGFSIGMLLLYLPLILITVVSMWKIFTKAGRPGWAAIVPFYNVWVLAEIAGRPGWWGLVATLVAAIPFVGWIPAVIMWVIISIDLAHKFGKSTLFGVVGLFLFSIVGYLMLAFGKAQYQGNDNVAEAPYDANTPVAPQV